MGGTGGAVVFEALTTDGRLEADDAAEDDDEDEDEDEDEAVVILLLLGPQAGTGAALMVVEACAVAAPKGLSSTAEDEKGTTNAERGGLEVSVGD